MHAASDLVKKYDLAYVSDVGVQSIKGKSGHGPYGVYYLGGHAQRVGVYELSPSGNVTLKQAIIAAGMQDKDAQSAQIIRRNADDPPTVINVPLDAQLSDKKLNTVIEADDTIMLLDRPASEK
jgi:protein involved in polysaccharide export with SLBB domain